MQADVQQAFHDRDEEYTHLVDSLQHKIESLESKQPEVVLATNTKTSSDVPTLPIDGSRSSSSLQDCAPHVGTWIEPTVAAETYLQDQLRMVKTVGNFTGRETKGWMSD